MFKPEVEALRQNGITRTALPRLNDPKVIPLWFGEGDMVTPEFIREAAKDALDQGQTFYRHTRGAADLRDAVKHYLERLYGVEIDFERVTIPGSTMLGITLAAEMTLGRGDHGLIVGPYWPNIESSFRVTGADVGVIRQQVRDGHWGLDLDALYSAVRDNTRAVFVNSPCNPTGWIMAPDEQRALLEFCRARDITVIADEVYHRNVYGSDVAPSFLQVADANDPLIVVSGFSKAWAMTGWRLGWMITPTRSAEQLSVLAECFNTGSTTFTQAGGIAALERGEAVIEQMRAQQQRNRQIVLDLLGDHPAVELTPPDGAFYAFVRVPGLTSSAAFAERLLDEEDVGVAPGYTFGPGNEEFFRMCFAISSERLEEAVRRIVRFLDRHHNSMADLVSMRTDTP